MKLRYVVWGLVGWVLSVGAAVALVVGGLWWYFSPACRRTSGIVYGERHGTRLTLQVLAPRRPNGIAIVLVVSGGWRSSADPVPVFLAAPLLRRGYTVFAASHVSQPEATVTEIAADLHRAVRFVRCHAREYGVDPARIGVTGGSAGGHLSLLLATRGGPGPADAPDPVDRESSAVQAVAIFYPVTDLLNLGRSTENPGDGGPPKSFVKGFGPGATDLATWKVIGRELSPIYHVTPALPPVLILHGDADTLTPLDQATRFQDQARAVGRTVEIVVRRGQKHGWPTMAWDIRRFADWFDRYLVATAPAAGGGSAPDTAR